ncbi:MAG: DNA-binding protein [Thermodesulfobacteriota bacterium]
MPEKKTKKRALKAKRQGKSGSTQAGEYVREEIHHVRQGKHGARSTKQAIAIGLSKARRAGVKVGTPKKGTTSASTRKKAARDTKKGQSRKRSASKTRSRATSRALKREGRSAASRKSLSRQGRSAAKRRSAADRSAAAKKAARTRKANRAKKR